MVEALEAGALAQGYANDLWTLARGAKLIAKISSKRYSECVAAQQEIELILPAAERSREASAAAILH